MICKKFQYQKTRTLNLSIKEIEIKDEKEALSKYGSSDSGASLGDILGSILKKKEQMLKSDILKKLEIKQKNLSESDVEQIFNIFSKKIVSALKNGKNVEIRGFGTFKKKLNKAKQVRNPKTNEKIFKKENFKLHFKIGKILHTKLNSN